MDRPYWLLVYVLALYDSAGCSCAGADGCSVSAGFWDVHATRARPRTSNITKNTVVNLCVLFSITPPSSTLVIIITPPYPTFPKCHQTSKMLCKPLRRLQETAWSLRTGLKNGFYLNVKVFALSANRAALP